MNNLAKFLITICLFCATGASLAQPLTSDFTDDSSLLLDRSPGWVSVANVVAYQGSYLQTSDPLATIELETYADGFSLLFFFDPAGDTAEICIDTDCVTVSMLGAVATGRLDISGLEAGLKTISISKITNDPSVISFDGIYIYPESPAQQGSIENTFTYEGDTYSGSFEYVLTAGDSLVIVLLSVLTVLSLFSLIMGMVKES